MLVALSNGQLAMIVFNGFKGEEDEGEKTKWKFIYQRQSVGVNCIAWKDDKSGDFVTSTRKVGALRYWNVATNEPKQVVKVGSHGIHLLRKLKNDRKRLVIAFTNGAVCVFNTAKKRVEFQTEAGHAETVFDLEFCPSNKDLIASCSYDGTVRVWDANSMKLLQTNETLRNTPLSKEEKHIIYSISWHPKDPKIVSNAKELL